MGYKPKCITLVYFEPGLTPFVQPLDAGIICCFKAHYCQEFCHLAIKQDEADEQDIYKIDLLMAMIMAKDVWKSITLTTIKNCWDHISKTSKVLRSKQNWNEALQVLQALHSKLRLNLPNEVQEYADEDQHTIIEKELQDLVSKLKDWKHIVGDTPTIDELLDPVEEHMVGGLSYEFNSGDDKILAYVQDEVMEVNDKESDSDSEPETPQILPKEIVNLCRIIGDLCVKIWDKKGVELAKMLCQY
ncbi:hypothetical protein FRC17_004612 [Serendipita sp. 399]|nr:hypothetical protein FRC17_004612 [Serendipita sp. 399]